MQLTHAVSRRGAGLSSDQGPSPQILLSEPPGSTTWGSWLEEGAAAEVGKDRCARRSFPEAAAATNGKGENTPPHSLSPLQLTGSLILEIIT